MKPSMVTRLWRLVSMSLLLFGFFTPWLTSCGQMVQGTEMVVVGPGMIANFVKDILAQGLARVDIWTMLLMFSFTMLALGSLLYLVLSLIQVFVILPDRFRWISMWIPAVLLLIWVIWAFVALTRHAEAQSGFWLTGMGLLLGLLVESQ